VHRIAALCCALCAALLAACGGPASPTPHPVPATRYLLSLDQLITPDFTVNEPPHTQDATALAGGDATVARTLRDAGLQSAATVRYVREIDVSTANGPIDVIDSSAVFAGAAGAHRIFGDDVRRLDAQSGATSISTGPLGDEAHAAGVVRQAASGVALVQITVEWRVGNLLNILVVRGRNGGTRLDDALILAHQLTSRE